MLQSLDEHETTMVSEEVHKGACNGHIGEKTLAHKILKEGFIDYPNER